MSNLRRDQIVSKGLLLFLLSLDAALAFMATEFGAVLLFFFFFLDFVLLLLLLLLLFDVFAIAEFVFFFFFGARDRDSGDGRKSREFEGLGFWFVSSALT
jgi:hypothetical protein